MFSYIIGFVALVVVFYNPIVEMLSHETIPQIRRTPLGRLNTDLLATEDDVAVNGTGLQCPQDAYSVHIYSREPLVLYIEGFLSGEERAHLLDIRYLKPRLLYC